MEECIETHFFSFTLLATCMKFNGDSSQTSALAIWSLWNFLHRMYFVKILLSSLVTENRKLGSLRW